MFELMDDMGQNAVIKVVGVGGGGGNAIQYMVSQGVEGVDFVAINTDAQVLRKANAKTTPAPRKCGKAATWCSSPPAWVAAPAPAHRRWWRKWPRSWTSWWSRW